MGDANEGRRRRGMENLSLENFPRDPLQRFVRSSTGSSTSAGTEVRSSAFRGGGDGEDEEEDSEDLELNLGLSLGGRFGVDKSKKSKLVRSSSIIGTVPFVRNAAAGGDDPATPALVRTASLPVETEEEWRKRKEIQTLRRMAAKRRRLEKQRSGKAAEKEDDAATATVSRQNSIVGGGVDLAAAVAAVRGRQPNSQGSAESQGGSSSGMSELESRAGQGSSSYGETRSPVGGQPSGERSQEAATGPSGSKASENRCLNSGSRTTEDQSRNPNPGGNKGREIGMNAMEDMPCVFTKGEGPNGRRVDGILYRYGKGEEVRIMCVCHGKFLSPAEFVKHAGGGDVDHPLRHIVINPSSASFL